MRPHGRSHARGGYVEFSPTRRAPAQKVRGSPDVYHRRSGARSGAGEDRPALAEARLEEVEIGGADQPVVIEVGRHRAAALPELRFQQVEVRGAHQIAVVRTACGLPPEVTACTARR